jgi:FkbM family methyltransferase
MGPPDSKGLVSRAREVLSFFNPATVDVETPRGRLKLSAASRLERWRGRTLLTKEPGTVAWIRRSVQPGDIFYDVGANVGVYTLLAALQVGQGGRVIAFEPHIVNCARLLHNIALNSLQNVVTVICAGLHDSDSWLPFGYSSLEPASSNSQLGHNSLGATSLISPVVTELKLGMTIDHLVATGAIPPPTYVKVDVDGNEPQIVRGMTHVLCSSQSPKEVQVEVNEGCAESILSVLGECGYEFVERHDTSAGAQLLAKGIAPEAIAHNVIFRRARSSGGLAAAGRPGLSRTSSVNFTHKKW